MSEDVDTSPAATDFAAFVTDIDHGSAHKQLSEKLGELVAAVQDVGKPGTMTVKFNIKKESGVAIVSVECVTKLPDHPMNGAMFWFGDKGKLLRDDPRQLKLKGLAKPKGKLKTVAFPTGEKEG